MRPGVEVSVGTFPAVATIPTDTGTAFAVGLSDRGPLGPILINQNIDRFVTLLGARQTYSPVYDWVDTFFREGGNRLYFSRIVGPGATTGTRNLLDGGGGISLVVNANGPGAWSSSYKVQVTAGIAGGSYRILVLDASNVVLETSDDLFTQDAAVQWAKRSNYIRIALGVTALLPAVVAAAALSAGTDDRGSITDTQIQTALDLFTRDLGPGQVVAPGYTTDTVHAMLSVHAGANGRVDVPDLPNTPTKSTLEASAAAVGTSTDKRFSGAFAPWVVVPGISNGTTRTVPASAAVCGVIARNDPTLGTNTPSAGDNGRLRYVIDLSQPTWNEPDMQELNSQGINVIRRMYNGIQIFGFRSLADPVTDKSWLSFASSRLIMTLRAEFTIAGNKMQFKEMDGLEGRTIGEFKAMLTALCNRHWTAGELFGATSDQAFIVDMSGNTLNTMANLELHATVQVKASPFAEWIPLVIVKRDITEVF
jgi:hypothetical protein